MYFYEYDAYSDMVKSLQPQKLQPSQSILLFPYIPLDFIR